MSRFTRSRHLPLGLPLGRLPGISMPITCLRLLSCSLRCTCPNHLSLLSLVLLFILPTPSSFLISSLFILSFTVTPLILLSILISVFSRIFSLSLRSSSILLHTRWQVSPLWYIAWSLTLLVSFYLLSLAPVLSIFPTQPWLLLLLLFLIHPLRWKWPLGIWTDPLDSAPCLPYLWCSP